MKSLERINQQLRSFWQAAAPGPRAWRGAAIGALTALLVILLNTALSLFGHTAPLWFLVGAPLFGATFLLLGGLVTLVWVLLRRLPLACIWALASALPALLLLASIAMSVAVGVLTLGGATLAVAALLGAGAATLRGGGWRRLTRTQRAIALSGLALGLVGLLSGGVWLLSDGTPLTDPPHAARLSAGNVTPFDLANPAQSGPYPVRTLFYGSGSDLRRPEYGAQVDLRTTPVDGSTLVEGWSRLRTAYWGFDPTALPRNGRVWYPEGAGPFPLVLLLHGQHPMEDFSDPGYAYLGEHLASRGFIAVSVDENFLNLSPLVDLLILSGLQDENDLRGWLLLEHLRLWRDWNTEPASPFYRQLDLERIALIGHSRGGEAVAIAAAFNTLSAYPDDATLRFDYGFGIRAVVGLAPVEGTYRPADREITLTDVSYLVLHGVHDMDVFTFQGSRQYARVHLGASQDSFKAAVYIYGANHGQFNTVWGRKDLFEPLMRVFNLRQLLSGEQQRQIAQTTISAFLETTLHGETEYRALFQDLRRGRAWLPDTIYLSQYWDAATQTLVACDEDADVTTATLPGGRLDGAGLTVWREGPLKAKWGQVGNQAVTLGWNRTQETTAARYTLYLPSQAMTLTRNSTLVLALADASAQPAATPVDLTVEVADDAGETARLPLSHFMPLYPRLTGRLGKAGWMSPFLASEPVWQHYEFPLADFAGVNPAFDLVRLVRVGLIFDRTEVGVIALDEVGVRP